MISASHVRIIEFQYNKKKHTERYAQSQGFRPDIDLELCFHSIQVLTHFTDVHRLRTGHEAGNVWRAGGRCVLVFSQAPLKLHKLRGAVLADLLDHRAVDRKEHTQSV